VSACRRLPSIINSVETSWSLSPCRKAVLLPRTPIHRRADPPIRRYADPLPQRRLGRLQALKAAPHKKERFENSPVNVYRTLTEQKNDENHKGES
jgi:hypothetical protein